MSATQMTQNKPARLRLLSSKSAADIMPEVREDMLEQLRDNPDPESLTRRFGSTTAQVIFSILWAMAWKVERLERLRAKESGIRDGFGRPRLAGSVPSAFSEAA